METAGIIAGLAAIGVVLIIGQVKATVAMQTAKAKARGKRR